MRNTLLYLSFLFLVLSCKAEIKNNIKKDSIEIESDLQLENETWCFYSVSKSSIIQLGNTSRESILEQFKDYKIQFLNGSIKVINKNKVLCSNKIFNKIEKDVLSYWSNKENVSIYQNLLNQENIKLPNQVTVILTGVNSDDACEYPFGEFIKLKDIIFLVYDDYLVFFIKEKLHDNFAKEYNKLSNLSLPINYDLIDSLENSKFTPISDKFKHFFNLDYLSNYKAIKLSKINSNIKPIIVSAYQEVGERNLYLYTLSQNHKVIDKLRLFSIEGETEYGNNVGRIFNIDKNYIIKITSILENDKMVINYYKINNYGKFEEIKK